MGQVSVSTDGAEVICRSSWAVNRARRRTVPLNQISDAVSLSGAELGLSCGEAVPDLSW
ncbi:Uncharacterised protein [Mycolicibacterium tokaiense]|uniref:Uncharacterized protein n=1 Tax=Mycolicibacterium tokaiense TaxID=39695 RepID=A0A378THM5_9MYCO|nr:Uncharacterised protein [Mycolicibacterium tokaiense]